MKRCIALCIATLTLATLPLAAQETPTVTAPQPTVPEVFTLTGSFTRLAYNNEGFVTMGYRMANEEQGKEWMLLDVGITLRKGVKDYPLTREHLFVKTPDGAMVPLATNQEYKGGNLRGLNNRAKVMRQSINYFPIEADSPCAMSFFAETGSPNMAWDQVELSYQRACVGRLYFKIPGGIKTGQHWLIVKFPTTEVQVPFRVVTPEEEKILEKKWQDFKKQLDAQYEK
jgi:hypothetical protein